MQLIINMWTIEEIGLHFISLGRMLKQVMWSKVRDSESINLHEFDGKAAPLRRCLELIASSWWKKRRKKRSTPVSSGIIVKNVRENYFASGLN